MPSFCSDYPLFPSGGKKRKTPISYSYAFGLTKTFTLKKIMILGSAVAYRNYHVSLEQDSDRIEKDKQDGSVTEFVGGRHDRIRKNGGPLRI